MAFKDNAVEVALCTAAACNVQTNFYGDTSRRDLFAKLTN
jgi:hypothetical protein